MRKNVYFHMVTFTIFIFQQVARRASVIKKRRFSKTRFDLAGLTNHIGERKDSEASVMFLPDDHHHRHTGWQELNSFRTYFSSIEM